MTKKNKLTSGEKIVSTIQFARWLGERLTDRPPCEMMKMLVHSFQDGRVIVVRYNPDRDCNAVIDVH